MDAVVEVKRVAQQALAQLELVAGVSCSSYQISVG